MVKLNLIISISFVGLLLNAQTIDTITDKRDGGKYKIVKIGNQWWTAQNIDFKASTGSWYYDDDSLTYSKSYGRLYNWDAAMHCCPDGWHLPSDEEWKQLEMTIGLTQEQADGENLRGTIEGGKLKVDGYDFWESPNTGATDEYGFAAVGSGFRSQTGTYRFLKNGVSFWTSSDDNDNTNAWFRSLHYDRADIHRGFYLKDYGYSVRCVKDTLTTSYIPNFNQEKLNVYPNPCQNELCINTSQFSNDNSIFRIQSLSGRELFICEVKNKNAIDISNLDNGLYLIEARNNKTRYIQIFIVQK